MSPRKDRKLVTKTPPPPTTTTTASTEARNRFAEQSVSVETLTNAGMIHDWQT